MLRNLFSLAVHLCLFFKFGSTCNAKTHETYKNYGKGKCMHKLLVFLEMYTINLVSFLYTFLYTREYVMIRRPMVAHNFCIHPNFFLFFFYFIDKRKAERLPMGSIQTPRLSAGMVSEEVYSVSQSASSECTMAARDSATDTFPSRTLHRRSLVSSTEFVSSTWMHSPRVFWKLFCSSPWILEDKIGNWRIEKRCIFIKKYLKFVWAFLSMDIFYGRVIQLPLLINFNFDQLAWLI